MQPPPVYQQPPNYGQQQWGYQQQPPYYQQYGYGWQPRRKHSSSMWPVILLITVVVLFGVGAYFIFAGDTSLFKGTGSSDTSSSTTTEESTEETETETESEPEQEQVATEISAKELIDAYEADAEVAKGKYNGKLLIITGSVNSMNASGDAPYVLLTGGETYTTGAMCVFDAEDVSKLSQLELGQTVKVQGTIGEYVLDVTVNNCNIIQ